MGNKFFRLQRIKEQLKRFIALAFTLLSAFLFIISTHSKSLIFDKISSFSRENISPIFNIVSTPFEKIHEKMDAFQNYFSVSEENKRLRHENRLLKEWQNKALSLSIENKELTEILNYQSRPEASFKTVMVLAEHHSIFSHSLILAAGKKNGIQKGDVLLLNGALFGHVIEVGQTTSRALKLSDYYSRLPVFVGQMKEPAILVGDNSDEPDLVALPEEATLKEGDFVFSSGVAGVYPQGLAIGYVKKVKDGFKVRLMQNKNNLGFVEVVNFGLSGLIEEDASKGEKE